RLHYGYIGIDYVSYALTGIGIVALAFGFRAGPGAVPSPRRDPFRQRRRREQPAFTFPDYWAVLDARAATEDDQSAPVGAAALPAAEAGAPAGDGADASSPDGSGSSARDRLTDAHEPATSADHGDAGEA